MTPPHTLRPNRPQESVATDEFTSTQVFGVIYITLTGLIDSMVPASGPWAVLGKLLSYIVKLAPILWWALPAGPAGCLPAISQEPPTGWIPDTKRKCVMNDISILVLKTQELNPGSQEADPTCQTSPGPANPLKDRLDSVNYSAFRWLTTEDPSKITQVTQSGRGTARLLNCKPELTSYSETRQPPRDNSSNGHQIDANLEPPKTQTYAEIAACHKEVKIKPIFNLANGHQQLPVSRPEGVVQLDYSGDIVNSGGKTKCCLSNLPEQAQPGSAALETPSQDPQPATALSVNLNPAKIKEAKSQGIKTLAVRQNPHCHF
ncbi:hypothetical protein DSO57_1036471 [Entomophthora muscae]|uniref:Uncharacterized protein n=1 Tax=Entomophthora muscae TaxID=34485 RepID=A0ACC2T9X7_9FUNG|nr:hypothetical protein DSO57_1036471 [Entomophthora muscae]